MNITMQARHPSARPSPRRWLWLIAPAALILQACGDGDEGFDFDSSRTQFETEQGATAAEQAAAQADALAELNAAQVIFNPADGELPFPNDLLFSGSEDGTLNIPVELNADGTAADSSDPVIALNQLDGFSTVAPIAASTTEALDPTSVTLGQSVLVFSLGADGIPTPLAANQIAVQAVGNQVVLLPVQPLASNTRYLVLLTNGIMGADGRPLEGSLFYNLAKSTAPFTTGLIAFEPVRQQVQGHLQVATAIGLAPDDVVLSWTFKTQSIREPLQAARDLAVPSTLVLASAGLNTMQANPALQGKADLFAGTLDLPYYLGTAVPGDPSTAANALGSFWKNASGSAVGPLDWTPMGTTVTVPVLMSVPNATSTAGGVAPEGGWPVTIFQHGITRNRSDMLAIADGMADAGRVVIAIDQPVHGIVDTDSPLYAGNTAFPNDVERTFDIDVATVTVGEDGTTTTTQVPDGNIDSSGSYYFNLQNLANTRDNLRQSAADLMTLSQSIEGALVIGADGAPGAAAAQGIPLNASNKSFVGHSLGGIVGTTALSYDDSFQAATLAMPGGGLAQLLVNSGSFGPVITAGLAAAGIEPGSADFNQFLVAAQSASDSGDSINHASFLAADQTTGLHLIQVEGDGTIPNAVATAPLAGTAPLAQQLGLPQVDSSVAANRAYVRFSVGGHGSILAPDQNTAEELAVTVEMQTQTASFAATQGQQLQVSNPSVIVPVGQ